MKPLFRLFFGLASAALLLSSTGCVTGGDKTSRPPRRGSDGPASATPEQASPETQGGGETIAGSGSAALPDSGAFYAEEVHEGRMYIIGKTSTLVSFLRNKDLPNSVTKPDKGPRGEVVVVETDPANPALEQRLWNEFLKWNFYYQEEKLGGQTYVIGKLQSHLFFLQNKDKADGPKLPSSVQVTLPGTDPAVVVNFETEEGNEHLLARLKAEYGKRNAAKVETP